MKKLFLLLLLTAGSISCNSTPIEPLKTEEMNNADILKSVRQNNIRDVVKALKEGANVNTADESQRSLLLIATEKEQTEMARLLVQYGADVNQQASNADSPFLYAGASGQTALVELFLLHGARFDVFNRYNGSALIPACERGHVATVRLLAHTPNYPINHINRLGWTALMEAVLLGDGSLKYREIVQILKEAGANTTIPDHNGVTPLQHAQAKGYKEIAELLKS